MLIEYGSLSRKADRFRFKEDSKSEEIITYGQIRIKLDIFSFKQTKDIREEVYPFRTIMAEINMLAEANHCSLK